MEKLIIYAATGYPEKADPKFPSIPATWEAMVEDAVAVREAGASIIHFHGPHDNNHKIVPEAWGKLAEDIRKKSGLLIDMGQAGAPLPQRTELMKLGTGRPDFMGISLTNHDYRRHDETRGDHDVYYQHPRPELIEYAQKVMEYGIKPNWEVWHLGGLWNFNFLKDQGLIEKPYWFNLLFGTPGGVWSPPTMEEINHRIRHVPEGSHYLLAPRGTGGATNQTRMLTLGIIQGGHVRVGSQDLPYYWDNVPAESNAQIVSRIARIAREVGREIATPEDVRRILGMKPAK